MLEPIVSISHLEIHEKNIREENKMLCGQKQQYDNPDKPFG